ncbi:hypothetical protein JHD49_03145 [Sulfurimonas sp. SAG-AH-194-C21]|nr:hypothetical protein [Sulfurimonas sp. SAG-AH-194-C21]MDF1882928.1 hypothetical protein [Sulfurimonas sp. SAG-AH-194-C21]
MKNKTIIQILFLGTLLLTGCGGEEEKKSNIALTSTLCAENASSIDIDNYQTLLAGDTIVKDDDNAMIEVYSDSNGTKKVCLVDNGSLAHIVR